MLDVYTKLLYKLNQLDSLNYPIARALKRVGYCESIDRAATVTTGDTTADRSLLQLPFQGQTDSMHRYRP